MPVACVFDSDEDRFGRGWGVQLVHGRIPFPGAGVRADVPGVVRCRDWPRPATVVEPGKHRPCSCSGQKRLRSSFSTRSHPALKSLDLDASIVHGKPIAATSSSVRRCSGRLLNIVLALDVGIRLGHDGEGLVPTTRHRRILAARAKTSVCCFKGWTALRFMGGKSACSSVMTPGRCSCTLAQLSCTTSPVSAHERRSCSSRSA